MLLIYHFIKYVKLKISFRLLLNIISQQNRFNMQWKVALYFFFEMASAGEKEAAKNIREQVCYILISVINRWISVAI